MPPPSTAACEDDGNDTYLSMDSPPPRESSSPESAYSVAATTLQHTGQLQASEFPKTNLFVLSEDFIPIHLTEEML